MVGEKDARFGVAFKTTITKEGEPFFTDTMEWPGLDYVNVLLVERTVCEALLNLGVTKAKAKGLEGKLKEAKLMP